MGEYWFTTLSAVRRGEPDWSAIAAYEAPLRRFLRAKFGPSLGSDLDDVVQEALLAMRERIVRGYDAGRGPFRSFLRTAAANVVRDRLRRRRPEVAVAGGMDAIAAADADAGATGRALVPDDVAAAIDLEALVVQAVRAVHDRFAHGPERELGLVYALSGVLVHGLSNREIARREGLSADQVKRLLQRARGEVLLEVFRRLLGGRVEGEAVIARAAELGRACLREPRRASRALEDERDPRVREAVEAFVSGLRDARATLGAVGASGSSGDACGDPQQDLLRGLEAIFQRS